MNKKPRLKPFPKKGGQCTGCYYQHATKVGICRLVDWEKKHDKTAMPCWKIEGRQAIIFKEITNGG